MELLSERLHAKMPLERLKGGYAYITVKKKPLSSISEVKQGEMVKIVLKDGELNAQVQEILSDEKKILQ